MRRPDGTGTVGAAVKGGGWVITTTIVDRTCWICGTVDVNRLECAMWTYTLDEAAWWKRVTDAQAWAKEHLEPTRRNGSYMMERIQFKVKP